MPFKDLLKRREAHKRYYAKNTVKYYEKNLKRKQMLHSYINSLKNKPCMDCNILYPPYVMDFDHRDGKDKIRSIAQMIRDGLSKKRIQLEVNKCDLVCSNCHRKRTYNRLKMLYNL